MRRTAIFLALAATLLPAAPAGAQGGATLSPIRDDAPFPSRSFVFTLPEGAKARPDHVAVREEGRAVRDLSVVPAAQRAFGVMLVLDASKSMAGEPIEDAMEAARAFAQRRPSGQPLGLVTFSGQPRVVLRPTTDAGQIAGALSRTPVLEPHTAINDGVGLALQTLRESGVDAGAIVVLSDGADTASAATTSQVAEAARRQDVRIFSVGLESGAFSPTTLKDLADSSAGEYSLAETSGSLRDLFDALGGRLAGELVMTYQSLEPAGSTVEVVATAPGGIEATTTYQAPALRMAPVEEAGGEGFWVSSAGVAGVAVLVGVLVAVAMSLVLRRPRGQRLRERMEAFGFTTRPANLDLGVDGGSSAGAVYERLQRRLADAERWQRFEERVGVARIPWSPVELASRTAIAAAVLFSLAIVLGGGPLAAIALAAGTVVAANTYLKIMLRRQRTAFADQLADSLQVMAAALRAGHSLAGALSSVVDDAPEPTRTEFARVRADERLGVPIEESIKRMAQRMDNDDLTQVAIVASLQQQTGGNTAEVLDRVVDAVRERSDLRRLVRTLTAQGRMGHIVVTLLPVGVGGYLAAVNPGYVQPFFEPGAVQTMGIVAIVMLAAGSYFIRRIVDIKV